MVYLIIYQKYIKISPAQVDRLHNVNQLQLVLHGPDDLVIVTSPKVNHDVLVPEEKHDGEGVVQLVHLIEVGHLRDVHQFISKFMQNSM